MLLLYVNRDGVTNEDVARITTFYRPSHQEPCYCSLPRTRAIQRAVQRRIDYAVTHAVDKRGYTEAQCRSRFLKGVNGTSPWGNG